MFFVVFGGGNLFCLVLLVAVHDLCVVVLLSTHDNLLSGTITKNKTKPKQPRDRSHKEGQERNLEKHFPVNLRLFI